MVQYFYDSAGRKTKVGAGASGTTDPVENFYDGTTGLLTKVRYTNGGNTDDASMFYDTNGRLTKITDWNGGSYGLQYVYDNAGRVVTLKDYDNRALTYAYDAANHITSMTDWHGYTTTYSYTDVGQVSTVTAPGSKVWDYDYNAAGRPTKVTAPNGMTTEYTYDGTSRMTKIAYKDGANTVDSFTYGLTPGTNITKITHNDGSYWDYANDTRGRLTSAVRKSSGGATQTSHAYVYDAGDNMLSKTVDAALSTFGYTVANELTSQTSGGATTSFAYDALGRMTSKTQGGYSAAYAWRYDSKLYSVTSNFPGEGTVNYQYRGDGRRHSRTVSGSTTRYNWDKGWNTVSEGDSSNNLQTTFTIDSPMAEVAATLAEIASSNPSTGTAKYYFRDHLGSTRRVHAADKSTLATTEYQPYGDTYSTSGTQPAFTFTGKPFDATDAMYYFPYRYYSPTAARWTTRDPLGMVDGPNLYGYVRSHVLGCRDLLGNSIVDDLLRAFGGRKGDFLDCVGKCLDNDPFVAGLSLPVWPVVPKVLAEKIFRITRIEGDSIWTTPIQVGWRAVEDAWKSVFGKLLPARPYRWVRALSKASPYLTIAEGAVSYGRIWYCGKICW